MKKNSIIMLLIVAVSGLAALVLRSSLYAVGMDSRGLLVPSHFLEILLWILTASVAVFVFFMVRRPSVLEDMERDAFGKVIPAIGCWLLALVLLFWGNSGFTTTFVIVMTMHRILAFLSAVALGYAGYCHIRGQGIFFGCSAVLALFFAVHMVVCYQAWSRNPQMQDYVFALLACALMAIFSYQQAAFCVGIGSRRKLLSSGLMGAYCSCAAASHDACATIYLVSAVWAMTTLLAYPATQKEEN